MDNATISPMYALSANIMRIQLPSHVTWVVLSVLGLFMSLSEVYLILVWKPLRKMEQALILALAVGDVMKSVGLGTNGVRRLYLALNHLDSVVEQRLCMYWLFGVSFPCDYSVMLILMLSLDRMLALAIPIWYKENNRKLKPTFILVSVMVGATSACYSVVGTGSALLLTCGVANSPTAGYQLYAKIMENSVCALNCFVNVASFAILVVRWRRAIKEKQNMVVFKRKVQLNAIKALFAITLLFLISTGTAAVFFATVTDPSLTPVAGSMTLIRSVFDFPLYVIFCQEYRKAFVGLFFKCRFSGAIGTWTQSLSQKP